MGLMRGFLLIQGERRAVSGASRVFHYNALYYICHMLTGIGALFQINIHLAAGDNLQCIGAAGMKIVHAGDKQAIRIFLHGIDVDDVFVQLFGMFEIWQIPPSCRARPRSSAPPPSPEKAFRGVWPSCCYNKCGSDTSSILSVSSSMHWLSRVMSSRSIGVIKAFIRASDNMMLLFVCRMLHSVYLLQLLGQAGPGRNAPLPAPANGLPGTKAACRQ